MSSFLLTAIDRIDRSSAGGRSAFSVDESSREDVTMDILMSTPGIVLYCYELELDAAAATTKLWFLPHETADNPLASAPFLDRAIRKHAALGERAFCVGLGIATAWLASSGADAAALPLVVAWNTGRCGSTLVHRIFSAAGVVSLSEPFWLDQLGHAAGGAARALTPEATQALLCACVLLDVRIARSRCGAADASIVSLNPKSFAHSLLRDMEAAFPLTRHLFLYRECASVCESFVSIFYRGACLANPDLSRDEFRAAGFGPPPFNAEVDFCAAELIDCGAVIPSDVSVGRMAASWVDGVVTWLRFADDLPYAFPQRHATMRMAELVCKDDLAQRVANVRALLEFAGVLAVPSAADDVADLRAGIDAFVAAPPERSTLVLRAALQCFGTHSQAGSAMEHSSTSATTVVGTAAKAERPPTYMTDADRGEVKALLSGVAVLTERGVCVDGAGAYIGGSIGLR